MSEEDRKTDTETRFPDWGNQKPIDATELGRFHRDRGVTNLTCQRCGNTQFSIVSNAAHTSPVIPMSDPKGDMDLDMVLALVALSCQRCGTLWLIDWGVYNAWQQEQRKGKEKENAGG